MKCSVIIVNYNVRYFLEQCILSIYKASKSIETEIIVVDNNSTDGSCEMVTEKFPDVLLIENKNNVGFGKANNQGVAIAKGEYICILNPDTALSENSLVNCINFCEGNENTGALGVFLMDGTGSFLPESKRNVPSPFISLLKLTGFTKRYYVKHLDDKQNGDIDVLAGAFMFLKRTIYNEVDGFDEDYFMYGEDIDLSYKIKKAGYQNKYLGNTSILHYKGESPQPDSEYLDRFYGAMQIFYEKHFKSNKLINASVHIAVLSAKAKNKYFGKKKNKPPIETEKTYLLTENIHLLRLLSDKFDTKVESASKAMFQDQKFNNCTFIFDADYIPYTQIFSIMKFNANKNNIFRIRPPGANFILGSDKSNQKGEVLLF